MSSVHTAAESAPFPADRIRPIASKAEGARLLIQFAAAMENLLLLIDHESELVRAGRLGDAARLRDSEAMLARAYLAACARLKANAAFFAQHLPREARAMRRRHDIFHALFHVGLAILAASRTVAESIARRPNYAVLAKHQVR